MGCTCDLYKKNNLLIHTKQFLGLDFFIIISFWKGQLMQQISRHGGDSIVWKKQKKREHVLLKPLPVTLTLVFWNFYRKLIIYILSFFQWKMDMWKELCHTFTLLSSVLLGGALGGSPQIFSLYDCIYNMDFWAWKATWLF